jgi:shikimate 5-dehydrogenase
MQLLSRPGMYFIGVSTSQSSIMKIFPRWMDILGVDAVLIGHDLPLGAPPEAYRAIVDHIRQDPLAQGGLVTAHKIDLLMAARDLFGRLDPYAQALDEISSISKQGSLLVGHAKDPISSGHAWEAIVPPGFWGRGGEVLCLGGGGAAMAISAYVATLAEFERPRQFTIVDVSAARLDHAREVLARMQAPSIFEFILNTTAADNDVLMRELPPSSMVINATGMGKDRPGSPVTDDALFPRDSLVWELNYRGALDFLRQAERQAKARHLKVADGWVYFLHGWTQVIAEVFHLDLTAQQFAQLDEAASEFR